ncbi:PREDICTED: uncharacterized protein LOC104800810 isoform X2 [Tarenaya hassleriana]|uniref:uncharacterized protein LOC104800810 isoform X2 n=1 Tax=Tarenaya hassleriana TaxID=28532 RepID=UPI00053C862B|nr:PREDICTED: uncharacterized protein LOC104800810 isoform X2 [Tarenaya hassleriana]
MQTMINTHSLFGLNSTIIEQKQRLEFSRRRACFPSQSSYIVNQFSHGRTMFRLRLAVCATPSDVEDVKASSLEKEDVLVATSGTVKSDELKIHVEVSGERTREEFDNVFDKMVAAAQPIPGFRRVKGGKTPNIPRDILLEILGPSKVYKQVIKKVINSTIADYVEKEGLKVGKDLRIEQSYEDLEETFEPEPASIGSTSSSQTSNFMIESELSRGTASESCRFCFSLEEASR